MFKINTGTVLLQPYIDLIIV